MNKSEKSLFVNLIAETSKRRGTERERKEERRRGRRRRQEGGLMTVRILLFSF